VVSAITVVDECRASVSITSKEACPKFSPTAIVAFLHKYPWALGVFMIAVGAVVNFFGRKFFQWTLAALGFFGGALSSLLLLSLAGLLDGLNNSNKPLWLAIVCIIICIGLGVLCGWLLFRTWMVGACILGATAGAFGAIMLYQTVFAATENFWIMLVFIILGGGLGVLATYKFFDMLVIVATSFIGAYSFIRGISMFAGGFPNEIDTFDKLAAGVDPQFSDYFFIYLVVIVILSVLGVIFQRKALLAEADGFKQA
jgi:Domain of unknown function (DUF4203)